MVQNSPHQQTATIQNGTMKKVQKYSNSTQLPACLSWSPWGARNDRAPPISLTIHVSGSAPRIPRMQESSAPTLLLVRAPSETSQANWETHALLGDLVSAGRAYIYPRTPAEPQAPPTFFRPIQLTPQSTAPARHARRSRVSCSCSSDLALSLPLPPPANTEGWGERRAARRWG